MRPAPSTINSQKAGLSATEFADDEACELGAGAGAADCVEGSAEGWADDVGVGLDSGVVGAVVGEVVGGEAVTLSLAAALATASLTLLACAHPAARLPAVSIASTRISFFTGQFILVLPGLPGRWARV